MICNTCNQKLREEGFIEGVSVFCCHIDDNTKDTFWTD